MNKNIFKWTGIYIISTLFLCLDFYAAPVVTKNISAEKLINPVQADTSMDTSRTHRRSSNHRKNMNKQRSDSTSNMQRKAPMTDTSMTHTKKKMSNQTSMMRPPKDETDFISGMTRYLNRRVKLNPDQVDKVHQVLTDYFSVASSDINNINTASNQTDNNGQIYAGTHNPVDTTSYMSPYASLNHSAGTTNTYGTTSGSGSDTSNMTNQRAGAKSDSKNRIGGMGNNTTSPDVTNTVSRMNSGSETLADRSEELDQAGIKVEKQIESILTDNQSTKFASFKDNYIDLVRQQALTVKSK